MEVVSTSNLISSKPEKTTTACSSQNINSFVMPHDLVRDQVGSNAKEIIDSYLHH